MGNEHDGPRKAQVLLGTTNTNITLKRGLDANLKLDLISRRSSHINHYRETSPCQQANTNPTAITIPIKPSIRRHPSKDGQRGPIQPPLLPPVPAPAPASILLIVLVPSHAVSATPFSGAPLAGSKRRGQPIRSSCDASAPQRARFCCRCPISPIHEPPLRQLQQLQSPHEPALHDDAHPHRASERPASPTAYFIRRKLAHPTRNYASVIW